MDDFNNDGKTDFGCYDWEDGKIRYSYQADGFTFSSTVLETNVGWCKSNYQNDLDEYVTMADQASGQYHTCPRYRIIPDRTVPDRTKSLFFGRNTGPDDILSGPVRIPDRIRDKIPDPVSSCYRHGTLI